ncbi:restriction endonuclease subunit S [Neptunomonas phycophila]|uniref:restriction endonuclease subunit S n=1 Tax=Neptunomonas phycophila TaxID=1572645 RepID=UPI001C4C2B77|nr:restriction endonuclease subunit S [Neptunomonas phycophila]
MSHYPSYQVSDSSGFPEHWQAKRLRFAVKLNPSKNEIPLSDSELISFVPMDAVGEYGGIRLDEDKELGEIGSGYTYFRDNDVVVAKITPCFENGKGAIAKGLTNECAFGTTELHVLRADLELLDPDFLFYLTVSDWFRDLGESEMYGAGGQKRVPEGFIKDLVTGLPPKTEQQAIVGFLNHKTAQIDALIAKKQALLEKLAEQRTALISQAVTKGLDPSVPMKDSGVEWLGEIPEGWDVIQIKHLTPVKRGASPRPIADPKYFDDDGDYAWVRIADVSASDGFLETTTQRLSDLGASLSVKMQPGSLFLSIAGTVGKPIITNIKCCIHDGFVYFPSLPEELKELLYYIFLSGQPYLGLGKMGTQLNLNTDTVGSIKIARPSTSEVNRIVGHIKKVIKSYEMHKNKIEEAIQKLNEYRAALITNAVTGKIDVRDFCPNTTTEQKELAHG